MQLFLDFLGHGGFKLLILAVALVAHLMKRNAEKTLREGQPREMPNSMPPQDAMAPQNSAAPQPSALPKPPAAPQPPAASKPKAQSDSGSPWSSSSNPFDGKKK